MSPTAMATSAWSSSTPRHGKFKRYWGAYGNKPDDRQPGAVRSRRAAGAPVPQPGALRGDLERRPGLRVRSRQQPDPGVPARRHVREGSRHREAARAATAPSGTSRSRAIPQQTFLFVADGRNERVHIVLRESLQLLTSFGDGGRQPGQFFGVHSIATDSRGNVYTTETYEGKRLQKFVYKGLGPVTKPDQGTLWPKSR